VNAQSWNSFGLIVAQCQEVFREEEPYALASGGIFKRNKISTNLLTIEYAFTLLQAQSQVFKYFLHRV